MASPGSNSGPHGLTSPHSAISTPGWEAEVDSSRTWTPGTTPFGFSQPQTGDGRSRPQSNGRYGERWRTHIEKQRLDHITRLGLDQTPSKFTPENETATHHMIPRSESAGSNIGQYQAGPGTRQRLWSTGFGNHDTLVPARQSLSQNAFPNPVNSKARVLSPGESALLPVSNLAEPSRAATWTSQPLIPLSSFSDLRRPQFPVCQPQPSVSPWAVPASDNNSNNNIGSNIPLDPMLRLNSHFIAFNPPNALNSQDTTSLSIAHRNGTFTSEMSEGMHAQTATHQHHWQRDRVEIPNLSRLSGASATSARDPPSNPWRPTPLEAAVLASPLRFPVVLRPPALAAQPQAPASGLSTVQSIPPFRFPSSNNHEATLPTAALLPPPRIFPSPPSFYHPMNCRAAAQPQTQHEAHALLLKGFSPNYRGDPDVARNQSAAIPVEANCSLFLVGLAPDLTTRELLSGIRGVGRVYATHINPPAPERGHVFSAAKVVFFERAGAGEFCLAILFSSVLLVFSRFEDLVKRSQLLMGWFETRVVLRPLRCHGLRHAAQSAPPRARVVEQGALGRGRQGRAEVSGAADQRPAEDC